jgi:cytochrome c oxidase accessory protein FixG
MTVVYDATRSRPARPRPTAGPRPTAARPVAVVPAAVSGRFRRIKWRLLGLCLAIYYLVPFLRWDRGPDQPGQAVLFDLAHARIHLFALEIRPQEFYYLTGAMVLAVLGLTLMNTLAGRIWCGFLCPQTVWTDLFMLVERRIEGDRRERLLKAIAPLDARRVAEIGLKHAVWLLIAALTGGAFTFYFTDAPALLSDLGAGSPDPAAAATILVLTLTVYAMAGIAREKFCTFMCPWPRLQGAIFDPEAVSVNYRDFRGEQRMSVKKAAAARAAGEPAGDCVDCAACVQVCPMGIDIRQGPNVACINCGLCIDACDTTMGKLGRERGLIDFETWTNIERGRRGETLRPVRWLRPKVISQAAAVAGLVAVLAVSLGVRSSLDLGVVHERAPVAVMLSDGRIRNAYEVRVTNAGVEPAGFVLSVAGAAPGTVTVAGEKAEDGQGITVPVAPDETRRLRVTLAGDRDLEGPVAFTLADPRTGETVTVGDFFHLE